MRRPQVEQHAQRDDAVLGVIGDARQVGRGEGRDQARVLAVQLGQGVCVVTRRTLGLRVAGRLRAAAQPASARRVLGQELFYGFLRRRLVLGLFPEFDERGVRRQRGDLS